MDRSDEVVPTTDRVLKARFVRRVPEEQRDGARDTRSVKGVPWQHTSAETAGGELRARVSDLWSSTPSVGCSIRWFAAQRLKEDLHTHASGEGCVVAGRNSERSLRGECSSDRTGHGTERRQSSLVLYQARSGTR